MKTFVKNSLMILTALAVVCLDAYSQDNTEREQQAKTMQVEFTNPLWNGERVPGLGICKLCGGEGKSPELQISNIPDSANIIIIEFNDRDYGPLSYDGGHGAISVACAGELEIIVPSIPEQTFDIPKEVNIEHGHRAPKGHKGAYLGPCSCGYGNRYFAIVKAVFRAEGNDDLVLAQKTIELGVH